MSVTRHGFRSFALYLAHLIGDWRRPTSDTTPVAEYLREHVTDAWVAGLTPGQRDYLERTLAAALGTLRAHSFVAQGYTLRPWRASNPRQPGVTIQEDGRYRTRYYDWDASLKGWRDHPYRLTHQRADGKAVESFVVEPYSLGTEGLRSLLTLAEAGWNVSVTAEWALHYPGSTLRVCLTRGENP